MCVQPKAVELQQSCEQLKAVGPCQRLNEIVCNGAACGQRPLTLSRSNFKMCQNFNLRKVDLQLSCLRPKAIDLRKVDRNNFDLVKG